LSRFNTEARRHGDVRREEEGFFVFLSGVSVFGVIVNAA